MVYLVIIDQNKKLSENSIPTRNQITWKILVKIVLFYVEVIHVKQVTNLRFIKIIGPDIDLRYTSETSKAI